MEKVVNKLAVIVKMKNIVMLFMGIVHQNVTMIIPVPNATFVSKLFV